MVDTSLQWERERATWPNSAHSHFLEAAGFGWHVQRAGVGPGVLLIHGTGSSTHTWRDVLPALSARFEVLAVDLPGHAFTDAVESRHSSLRGMSAALAELLKAERFDARWCVGHSAGAAIACRMALDGSFAPQGIIGINGALMPFAGAAALIFAPMAKLMASMPFVPRMVAAMIGDRAGVERMIAGSGSQLDDLALDLYTRLTRSPKHVAAALAMMAHWELEGLERNLARIGDRLTLITSANDSMVPPAQARSLKKSAAALRLLELPDLGHLAHEEAPQRFAELLFELMQGA